MQTYVWVIGIHGLQQEHGGGGPQPHVVRGQYHARETWRRRAQREHQHARPQDQLLVVCAFKYIKYFFNNLLLSIL